MLDLGQQLRFGLEAVDLFGSAVLLVDEFEGDAVRTVLH
jgi:hypothetical protein